MVDLAREYRPRQFAQLFGQSRIVEWMRGQIRTKEPSSVLLAGPSGLGKTTLAALYAKAAICPLPDNGGACGQCDNCKDFDDRQAPDFQFLNCGENSKIEDVLELLETARLAPFGSRRVLVLDEVHALSRRAITGLLNILEFPPRWSTFVMTTTEKDALPPSLLSRVQVHELQPLQRVESFQFLSEICGRAAIPFDTEALGLMYDAVGGLPRAMLRAVETVAGEGSITEATVRTALRLDFDERLVSYANAVIEGDLSRQLSLIEDWSERPARKLEFLHQFYTYIYFKVARRINRPDALVGKIPQSTQAQLAEKIAGEAARLALPIEGVWEDTISVLEPRSTVTSSQLAMMLSRVDRLINRTLLDVGPIVSSTEDKMPRLRVTRQRTGSEHATYLPWKHLKPFWEIGSFLPQQFGVLFNLRLKIDHGELGIHGHDGGAKLVSALTRRLTDRVAYWAPHSTVHWMYHHEADTMGALVSRVLMAIPDEHLGRAVVWLRKFVVGAVNQSSSGLLLSQPHNLSSVGRVRFHWQSVRALSRNLDPNEYARTEGQRRNSLVDLLSVPRRWRAPAEPVRSPQRKGMSKWLTETSQAALSAEMPMLSALRDAAWSFMDSGWELEEFRARTMERDRRQAELMRLQASFPPDNDLSSARYREELRALQHTFTSDPTRWPREWFGWWNRSAPESGSLSHQAHVELNKSINSTT